MGRILFLLTPLREGRREFFQYIEPQIRISTHAPAGGATRRSKLQGHRRGISTHAPAGGATRGWLDANPAKRKFLLTPLREGRHQEALNQCFRFIISTHAPAGGATFGWHISNLRIYISTHAPAGGATHRPTPKELAVPLISTHAPAGGATILPVAMTSIFAFLLTPLREGRRSGADHAGKAYAISTHAPAGGATEPYQEPSAAIIISTHAPAGGATERAANKDRRGKFLLTPLREGRRHRLKGSEKACAHFYSRPCGRGDPERVAISFCMQISTHAPAGGATYGSERA